MASSADTDLVHRDNPVSDSVEQWLSTIESYIEEKGAPKLGQVRMETKSTRPALPDKIMGRGKEIGIEQGREYIVQYRIHTHAMMGSDVDSITHQKNVPGAKCVVIQGIQSAQRRLVLGCCKRNSVRCTVSYVVSSVTC